MKSFGILNKTLLRDEADKSTEELKILGYTIIEDFLSKDELRIIRTKIDSVYATQVNEFSDEELKSINELYLARMLFAYDDYFISLITNEKLLQIISMVLGDYFILHLQNGIINMPQQEHHQNSWHRDLPYQDFTSSKPLALSALYCIDDFTDLTGGTIVIPFSHKLEITPSDAYMKNHQQQITAKAGSIVLFDSMIFHKAGDNSSSQIRRGINHMFTAAILKQQINIPEALNGRFKDDKLLKRILGYEASPPKNVFNWREAKIKK